MSLNISKLMRMLSFIKIVCICFFTNIVLSAVETRMAYSDLISNDLQDFLYNDIISSDKGSSSDIQNLSIYRLGSLPIVEDFSSGNLDICILALPEDDGFPILDDDQITAIPFGYKSAVIVVNVENTIAEINANQLATIFGDFGANSKLITWRNISNSSLSSSPINAYATKELNGISSDLFRYSVLEGRPFSQSVTIMEDDELRRMLIQNKAAIGIFPGVPKDPNLKVLFLAQDNDAIAYGPSIDNIYYSDYFIRLPFYIVFKKDQTERLYPLIKTLLGDEVVDIIQKNNFYPLPKVIREKFIFDLQHNK